jgi:hypothetical protein
MDQEQRDGKKDNPLRKELNLPSPAYRVDVVPLYSLSALQPKGNTSDVTSKIQVTQHVDLFALIILDSKTEVSR